MNRDDDDSIGRWIVDVHDQHPAPGTEHEAEFGPAAFQRSTQKRETFEWSERGSEALDGVGRQAQGSDEVLQIRSGCRSDDNGRHALEVFQSSPQAGSGLPCPLLSAL